MIGARARDVGRVQQAAGAGDVRVEVTDEAVGRVADARREAVDHRQVARTGVAAERHAAVAVRDDVALVGHLALAAAEVRGVQQVARRRVPLHEHVVATPAGRAVGIRCGHEAVGRAVGRGLADDVDVAGRIDVDPRRGLAAQAADVGRVRQRPVGGEARVYRVGAHVLRVGGIRTVLGVRGHRVVGRQRVTDEVHAPLRVDVDGARRVRPAALVVGAAEQRRVDQRRAGRVELRDEVVGRVQASIDGHAGSVGLHCPWSDREAGAVLDHAEHVDVAGGVDLHRQDGLLALPPEPRRVDEHGIDDEGARRVVAADAEADPAGRGVARERAVHRHAPTIDLLVGHRRALSQHGPGDVHEQIAALRLDLEPVGALDAHGRVARIGPRCDHEVVLELPLIAVVDDVDAGPHLLGAHATVGAQPRAALAAHVAVDDTGQQAVGHEAGHGPSAVHDEADVGARTIAGDERHRGPCGADADVVAMTTRDVRRDGASVARLEVQRHRGQVRQRARRRGGRRRDRRARVDGWSGLHAGCDVAGPEGAGADQREREGGAGFSDSGMNDVHEMTSSRAVMPPRTRE